MSESVLMARPVRGAFAIAALVAAALAVASVGGPVGVQSAAVSPDLVAQFGVSAGAAASIVSALNSWWASALTIALVPLGLGFAAVGIRVTWTTLVRTLGKKAATDAMKRY